MFMVNERMTGFGNHFESEAIKGSLPIGKNSPQKVSNGLYAELLTGSAFTQPRTENKKVWLYRIRPSVSNGSFSKIELPSFLSAPFSSDYTSPEQYRWMPTPYPKDKKNFIESIITMAGCGDTGQAGAAVHHYACNTSMDTTYFYNSDGEMLIVPQEGRLSVATETGLFEIAPKEILVIPRGIKFKVDIKDKARGYILENYGAPFRLPDLGPIGSSGLANTRDFETSPAFYEKDKGSCELISKFCGNMFKANLIDSPLDVVAWHGNYVPYKYDLDKFNTINTVSYDHPDPSIFTVLTSPTDTAGKANIDFVIFPPRWMVGEETFRPPYYHRNIMSEYMGLIHGVYDAKEEGFVPGGASLHNCMAAHGPEKTVFEKASNADLKPEKIDQTLAFMFEGHHVFKLTKQALEAENRDKDYLSCWDDLDSNFHK